GGLPLRRQLLEHRAPLDWTRGSILFAGGGPPQASSQGSRHRCGCFVIGGVLLARGRHQAARREPCRLMSPAAAYQQAERADRDAAACQDPPADVAGTSEG